MRLKDLEGALILKLRRRIKESLASIINTSIDRLNNSVNKKEKIDNRRILKQVFKREEYGERTLEELPLIKEEVEEENRVINKGW